DDVGKAHDGLDRQGDRLALCAALDVYRARGKQNRKFLQQYGLTGAHRRRRPRRKSGVIPQRSLFPVDHRAQGRRVEVKEIAPYEIGLSSRDSFEPIGAAQVDHEPLRFKMDSIVELRQLQAWPTAPACEPAVRPQCFARGEVAAVHGLQQKDLQILLLQPSHRPGLAISSADRTGTIQQIPFMCKPIDLVQLSPHFGAALLVSEEAQQEFELPMMEQLNLDQRLTLGPVVVACLPNAVQKIFVRLEKRLAKPKRGMPGLPFEW